MASETEGEVQAAPAKPAANFIDGLIRVSRHGTPPGRELGAGLFLDCGPKVSRILDAGEGEDGGGLQAKAPFPVKGMVKREPHWQKPEDKGLRGGAVHHVEPGSFKPPEVDGQVVPVAEPDHLRGFAGTQAGEAEDVPFGGVLKRLRQDGLKIVGNLEVILANQRMGIARGEKRF